MITNIATSIEEGQKMLVEMEREILGLITKAHNGGFFVEEEKLAVVYSHVTKARVAARRAYELAVKCAGGVQ